MSVDVKLFNHCNHFTGGKQYTIETCPKCLGAGYYYDIAYDEANKVILTNGTIKLQQEVLKAMNDVKGENVFFPKYGSEIHGYVGRKSTVTSRMKMEYSIRQTLEYLRALQVAENNQYENMTSDEILQGVSRVDITPLVDGYDVGVTIANVSNTVLNQTIQL